MAHRFIRTQKVRAPAPANDEKAIGNVVLKPVAIAGILGFTAVWTGVMYPIGLLQRWRRK
jgi:hypothetical protein